ncbi:MAG: prohibitin family protein [Bacteroidales bacterium]|nr:prohibitin family protein [Bacteroidales bacterium]
MKKQLTSILIIAVILIILLVIFGSRMFKILEPTEAGILFKPLSKGLDKERIYTPGLHTIAPWNSMIIYDMREQIVEEPMDVLDKRGLSINIDVTLRFVPVRENIGDLYENFSVDYTQRLVIPELRSAARKIFGSYEAEEIYSTKRAEVEAAIIKETEENLKENNVLLKTLLIRSIKLPEQIRMAIDNKEEQRQIAEAMKYRLQKEELEAERKEIEAKGIANYNRIINTSLTDKILQQRGIDATLQLSQSQNTKVVVVGSGKDGLPLILGNQ